MSLKNFRAYEMAIKLYRSCQTIKAPGYVKDQLLREVQTILELYGNAEARAVADQTGALVFRLVQSLERGY